MKHREREFERNWQPKLWLSIGVLILLAAYVIAFVIANSDEASVNFIFVEARTSLIWVILLSLLAGLLGGMLLSQLYRRRQTLAAAATSDESSDTPSSMEDADS